MLPAPGPQVERYRGAGRPRSFRAARGPAPQRVGRRRPCSRRGSRAQRRRSCARAPRNRRRCHPHQHGGAAGRGPGGALAPPPACAALSRQHAGSSPKWCSTRWPRCGPPPPITSSASRRDGGHLSRGAARTARWRCSTTRSTRHCSAAAAASADVRAALGAAPGDCLIGTVGRIHPRKDLETFVRAAARIAGAVPDARFVIVGAAEADSRARLTAIGSTRSCANSGLGATPDVRRRAPRHPGRHARRSMSSC